MIKTDKLIITVCPVGAFFQKTHNPNIPIQPEEIGEEVYRCWNEGAAIVHIHARDKSGLATTDPEVFREIDRQIRKRGCDIIIQHSTSPGRDVSPTTAPKVEDGVRSLQANPEMASVDIGIMQGIRDNYEFIYAWTRSFWRKWLKYMLDKGIKPELEVFNNGFMEEVHIAMENGLLAKPCWISLAFDMRFQQCVRYTPKNLMHFVDVLPEDAMFSVLGIAQAELPATTMSILLGGHVRVGFEDNYYLKRGVLAEGNAQLVARAARFGRELGREIATPEEVRKLLNIPSLKPSKAQ